MKEGYFEEPTGESIISPEQFVEAMHTPELSPDGEAFDQLTTAFALAESLDVTETE